MKTIFIFFLSLIFLPVQAQSHVEIPPYDLDTALIKTIFKENYAGVRINLFKLPPIKDADFDNLILLRNLLIKPDSVDKKIIVDIDTNDVVLFFPKQPSTLYHLNKQKKFVGETDPQRVRNVIMRLQALVSDGSYKSGIHDIFLISLFPQEQYEYKYLSYIFQERKDFYVMDDRFRAFDSLSDLLKYNFGSDINFIETYRYRYSVKDKYRF
ncbi:MAG: hypothetical protein H6Q14_2488 [Bacteroidetes bacterium]|nr:hypothetical protein [Bacteroidota bacterium]